MSQKIIRICLDPGHGGKDPGAVGPTGLKESDMALDVCLKVKDLLEKTDERFCVSMTRTEDDEYIALSTRVEIANTLNADLFVSYHFNSADSNALGWEVFTSKGDTKSDRFASLQAISNSKVFPDSKIRSDWSDGDSDKEANFYVLRNTLGPAILIEGEFISTPAGEDFIRSDKNRDKMAYAVACGICLGFNIPSELVPIYRGLKVTIEERLKKIEKILGL